MKTVIEMAREAGCIGPGAGGDPNGLWEPNGYENVTELMFRFAELVRADEREQIAQMIEAAPPLVQLAQNEHGGCLMCGFTPKLAAAAIRARSEQ